MAIRARETRNQSQAAGSALQHAVPEFKEGKKYTMLKLYSSVPSASRGDGLRTIRTGVMKRIVSRAFHPSALCTPYPRGELGDEAQAAANKSCSPVMRAPGRYIACFRAAECRRRAISTIMSPIAVLHFVSWHEH